MDGVMQKKETKHAPHHHLSLWIIGLCQLVPTASLWSFCRSIPSPVGRGVHREAFLQECSGWVSVWCSIRIMTLFSLLMGNHSTCASYCCTVHQPWGVSFTQTWMWRCATHGFSRILESPFLFAEDLSGYLRSN